MRSAMHKDLISRMCLLLFPLVMFANPSFAASPWMAEAGSLEIAPIFIYERFEEFYRGGDRKDFPFEHFDQYTTLISFDYIVLDGVGLDLTLGYVDSSGGYNPMPDRRLKGNDGLQDVSLGIRFEVLDEFEWEQEWVPSLTVRLGGIIAGTYEATGDDFPGIPGDKSSGIEGEFSLGKMFPFDIGLTGTLGIRGRDKGTPIDWHLRVGAFKTFFDTVTVGFAYDQWRSISGIDIAGTGWAPDRFRELKEISKNIEVSLGFSDSGGRYYGAYYIKTVGGRNTGIKDAVGIMISVPVSIGSPSP